MIQFQLKKFTKCYFKFLEMLFLLEVLNLSRNAWNTTPSSKNIINCIHFLDALVYLLYFCALSYVYRFTPKKQFQKRQILPVALRLAARPLQLFTFTFRSFVSDTSGYEWSEKRLTQTLNIYLRPPRATNSANTCSNNALWGFP